jgi:hypothetical protein
MQPHRSVSTKTSCTRYAGRAAASVKSAPFHSCGLASAWPFAVIPLNSGLPNWKRRCGNVVMNIGNGVALNMRYQFARDGGPNRLRYIPNLLPKGRASLVETLGGYNAEHRATFDHESIGGRRYRTTIQLNHHVITSFVFEEVGRASAAQN